MFKRDPSDPQKINDLLKHSFKTFSHMKPSPVHLKLEAGDDTTMAKKSSGQHVSFLVVCF